jgi:hypothetical protein
MLQSRAAAAWSYNAGKAVAWARSHGNDSSWGWEYGTDCTNFLSSAMRAGGVRQQGNGKSYWDSRKDTNVWWERSWRLDSYTWAAAENHSWHFTLTKRDKWTGITWGTPRSRWVPAGGKHGLGHVKVGMPIYFRSKDNRKMVHVGMVTKVALGWDRDWYDIYFSQHGRTEKIDLRMTWELRKNYGNIGFTTIDW